MTLKTPNASPVHSAMAIAPSDFAAFHTAVAAYLAHLAADYASGYPASKYPDGVPSWASKTFKLHGDGKLYAKVIADGPGPGGSAHSFIVISDTAKFKRGDILKAASWKAPALNFKRGNIFIPSSYKHITWAGGL